LPNALDGASVKLELKNGPGGVRIHAAFHGGNQMLEDLCIGKR